MNGLRVAAHCLPHTGTMLKLTTVVHTSLSASGGSRGTKKKENLPVEELLQGIPRRFRVCEDASLLWLTGSATLVSVRLGLMLNVLLGLFAVLPIV